MRQTPSFVLHRCVPCAQAGQNPCQCGTVMLTADCLVCRFLLISCLGFCVIFCRLPQAAQSVHLHCTGRQVNQSAFVLLLLLQA